MASTCFQQKTASFRYSRPSKPAALIDVYFSEDCKISDDDDDDDICIYRHTLLIS